MKIHLWGSRLGYSLIVVTTIFCNVALAVTQEQATDAAYEEVLLKLFQQIPENSKKAMQNVWQIDALNWRWRMQSVACEPTEQNIDSMQRTLRSGYPHYLKSMNEQMSLPSLSNENIDLALVEPFVQDLNYMAYHTSARSYAKAYLRRLNILFHYHPDLKTPVCENALEQVKSVPDVYPNKEFRTMRFEDIRTNKVLLAAHQDIVTNMRYGARAFVLSMRNNGQTTDAFIYSLMLRDQESAKILSRPAKLAPLVYDYQETLNELKQGKSQRKVKYRTSLISGIALTLHKRMYLQATGSVLRRILEEYSDLSQPVVEHMKNYIQRASNKLSVNNQLQKNSPGGF